MMRFSWQQHSSMQLSRWQNVIVGLLLLLASSFATANSATILVLGSQDSAVYQRVASALSNHLSSQHRLQISYAPDDVDNASLSKYDLVITIGSKAAQRSVATQTNTAIFSTFIPKSSYTAIHKDDGGDAREGLTSGIFLEQPIDRQLQLLKLIAPDVSNLGTIFSRSSIQIRPELDRIANEVGFELIDDELTDKQNPVGALSPIISNSDAFLALPDRAVFNRSTAKWILLMTFRQKIPLLAFSKSYVDAGALAAIYSTPETVGKEAAEVVNDWIEAGKGPLPLPSDPTQFSLSINQGTAHSLGITVPDEQVLIERLSQ